MFRISVAAKSIVMPLRTIWKLIHHDRGNRSGIVDAVNMSSRAGTLGRDSAEQRYQLGMLALRENHLEEAEASFHKVLELNSNHVDAHLELARVRSRQNRVNDAIQIARRAVALGPDIPKTYYLLGSLLSKGHRNNNLEEAEANFHKVIELNSNHVDAHLELARVRSRQNRVNDAIQIARRAVALGPDIPKTYYLLGSLLSKGHRNNNLEEAEANFHKVIELNSNHVDAHLELARVQSRQNRVNDAIQMARRAVELGPDNSKTHWQLGKLLIRENLLTEAEAVHRKAIQLSPGNLQGYMGLLAILWRKKERDKFRTVYAIAKGIAMPTLPDTLQIGLGQFPTSNPNAVSQPGGCMSGPLLNTNAGLSGTLEQQQQWVARANALVSNWGYFNQDKLHEIDAISVYPDFAESLSNGGGALLVGGHLGSYTAGGHVASNITASKVVTGQLTSFNLPRNKAIILNMLDPLPLLFQMYKNLKQGNVVFWMGDAPAGAEGPPTLAYRARVPIFWYVSLWRNGKIVHQLRPGPLRVNGENLDRWLERWFSFYGHKYVDALSSNPENILHGRSYEEILQICDRARVPTGRLRAYLRQI